MLERYEPGTFEAKWQARWKEADLFKTREEEGRPKFYGLDFFPYPSGAGLSVGHCRNYIPTDVLCRMKIMQGFNVLHPMGFDAFGLPAENEAIKKKRNPAEMIEDYAANYRRQMELIGISFDWSRSFKSSDPEYYKWTQWIFKKLYEKGLAYRKMVAVNWDPVDKTVLADEEVIGGRAERSGALVEKKLIPQWVFKITAYADRLVDDLDDLDWPEGIKNQQRNWIGRSQGVEFEMEIEVPQAKALSPTSRGFHELLGLCFQAEDLVADTEIAEKAGGLSRLVASFWASGIVSGRLLEKIEDLADDLEDQAKALGLAEAKRLFDDIGDEAEDLLDEIEGAEDEEDAEAEDDLDEEPTELTLQARSAAPEMIRLALRAHELASGTPLAAPVLALAKSAAALWAAPQASVELLQEVQSLADDLEDEAEDLGLADLEELLDQVGDLAEDILDETEEVEEEEEPESEDFQDDLEVVVSEAAPTFRVFTTRIDTIYGVTFCVLAPEHPMVEWIKGKVDSERAAAISSYQKEAQEKSDEDRTGGNDKTGVFTGAYAVNPANSRRIPIFIADYVLMGYGTGAIMAVPAHDQRDFDFALAHGLDIIPVCTPDDEYLAKVYPEQPYDRDKAVAWYSENVKTCSPVFLSKQSILMNSGSYTGKDSKAATEELADWIEGSELGSRKTNFKLRDWLISRQRYWGCPIPISYDKEGEAEPVMDQALPVLLPDVENYEPSDDGSSPLSRITDFVNVALQDGSLGRRETDTMSGFACSSWYFLRFCDPFNTGQAWSPEAAARWMPVDCYVGGAEHAVMHLLYARFWTKFLYDEGLCPVKEPFARLMNQGQVLALTPYRAPREGETLGVGEDGILVSFEDAKSLPEEDLKWRWARMSKSKGNVVTPDEAVAEHGADALRVYELFVAPFEANIQWSNEGMQGASRFLDRFIRLAGQLQAFYRPNWKAEIGGEADTDVSKSIRRMVHKTIAKATEDIERFAFNTYISSLMVLVNEVGDLLKRASAEREAESLAASEALEAMILLLAPAAPHTADELWEGLGRSGFTLNASWPKSDPELAKDDLLTIAVQVNGKLRDTIEVPADSDGEAVKEKALGSAKVQVFLEGKEVKKVILVPGKLVSIVVG